MKGNRIYNWINGPVLPQNSYSKESTQKILETGNASFYFIPSVSLLIVYNIELLWEEN